MLSERLVIRASGFGLFIVFFVALLGMVTANLAIKNIVSHGFRFGTFLTLLIGAWLVVYSILLAKGNKIEVTDSEIKASSTSTRVSLFPRFDKGTARLGDIQSVVLGTMGYFDKQANEFDAAHLREIIDFWHGIFVMKTSPLPMPFPMWLAAKYTPLLLIRMKAKNDSLVISTKLFSKNSLRRLTERLKREKVAVHVQENLL
jgi:hypothetical protein